MRDRRVPRLSQELEFGEEGEIEKFARQSLATAPLPELDQKVAHRARVRQEQEDRAPFARINPPSVNNGVLGGQQVVLGGQASGVPPMQVVFWEGEDAETTAVTVTLFNVGRINGGFPTPDTGPPTNFAFIYKPYANVRWGTRAVMAEAKIDIASGCQFTVGASCVFISVGMDSAVQNSTARVGAMLSFFPTQKVTPITCTEYLDLTSTADAPLNVGLVTIPNFSRDLIVQRSDAAPPPFTLEVLDAAGVVIYVYTQIVSTYMMEPLRISNDARFVRVTNTSAVTTASFRLMFGLSF